MKNKKKLYTILICAAIIVALVILDQITKFLAVKHLSDGKYTFIEGFMDFRLVYNTGFAFGLGDGYQIIWAFVSLIGCFVIGYFFRYVDFKKNLLFTIVIILLFAGTFGNMIDRFISGKGVIDFFEPTFINFAVFNVADCFVTVGAFLLAFYVLFIYKEPEKKKDKDDASLKETEVKDETIETPTQEDEVKEND